MSEMIRWGILGNANIARKALIPAIHDAKNAELTAIASGSGRAEEAARQFQIAKAYDSYESLLDDPEIDVVYIPLPNALHAEWVMKAAKAGKHVLCEKPAALTAEETSNMIEVCRKHDVLFMEAFMYQFHPQHVKVKELITSGEIGDVKLMRSHFSFQLNDTKNVRFDNTLGGGCLYDVGCYCIHASRQILGKEPLKAYAQAHRDGQTGVDVTTAGVLSFGNGVQALFDASFEISPQESYEVIGEKGHIEVSAPFRPDKRPDGNGQITLHKDNGEPKGFLVPGDAYTLEVEHLSQCIAEGRQPMNTTEDTINNMKVVDACYKSIDSGQGVQLS